MSASFLRYRRCGPTGREIKSICASSRTRILRQSHRPQSCCVNVTQCASSTTSGRSRSASCRGFSTAPRACSRNRAARLELGGGDPVARRTPPGRIRRRARNYELELYLAVDKCEGLARGFYHYDAGGHALVPIACPHAGARSAVEGSGICNGRARRAPDPDHHCRALRQDFMEIQLDRLCAHSEGRRRVDANALPDGDRYGARRMCDRHHQYRSVRENDGGRIPRRGPGRSICTWSRRRTGAVQSDNQTTAFVGAVFLGTKNRAAEGSRDAAGSKYPTALSLRFPASANMAP